MLTLMDYLKKQGENTNKEFTNFVSKKELLNSDVLTKEQAELIGKLKNCFSFTLHNSRKYIIITMYYNATKKYNFLVVNLKDYTVVEQPSIKLSKQYVLEQLKQADGKDDKGSKSK